MALNQHTIRPAKAKKNKKRVGRGDASGSGSYSGKGMKGQNSRSGGGVRVGFEGGQLPLIRRLPSMRGFNNIFKRQYNVVNLDTLSRICPDGGAITAEILVDAGVLRNVNKHLKVLGRGNVTAAFNVTAHKFSIAAKVKIESAGGSAKVID